MRKTTLGFIYVGVIYLLIGITLGVIFFIVPETRVLDTVHVHLNLVGFVTFFIFGVAYHILPRFRGKPLYSEPLAWWHFWLANIGLVGLLVLIGLDAYTSIANVRYLQAAFGSLLALSMYLFAYNMLRTLIPPVRR